MPGGGANETQSVAPWGPVKAPAKEALDRALKLSRVEMPYYPGDTTAGMSADTQAALDMARAVAGGGNLGLDLSPTLTGLARDGTWEAFMSSPQGAMANQALMGAMGGNPWASPGLSTGPGATGVGALVNAATGGRDYGAIGDWAWGGSPEGRAMTQGLLATAGGQFLDPAANPTWRGYSDAAADAVQRQTAQRYLGAGQTLDNPAVTQTFSRDFASVMAPFASQVYENERGRQMAAQGQIGSLLQSGSALNLQGYMDDASRRAAAASSLMGLGATGTGSALQAAGILGDLRGQSTQAQLRALGLAPAIGQLSYLPSSIMEGVGRAREGYTQADMNDALLRWQYGQMEPWQRLQLLQGVVAPFFGGGGTTTGTGAGVNPLASTLGGGVSGAAAGAGIGSALAAGGGAAGGAAAGAAAGSVVPIWGTAIGAGLGALGGWLGSRG